MCARALLASCFVRVLRHDPREIATCRLGCRELAIARQSVHQAATVLGPTSNSPRARGAHRDRVWRASREPQCVFRRQLPSRVPIRVHASLARSSEARCHSRVRALHQAARLPGAVVSSSRMSAHRTRTMLSGLGARSVVRAVKLQSFDQGTEGGSRTHKPVRTEDFESSAFAIPPLRLNSRAGRLLAYFDPTMQCRCALGRLLRSRRPNAPEPNAPYMLYRSRFPVPRSP